MPAEARGSASSTGAQTGAQTGASRAGRQFARQRRFLALACLATLALGGCERGSGYIEIKVVPSNMRSPRLLLDSTRLEPIRDGQAILTASAGSHQLQMEWIGGQNTVLCAVEVRKDRITTVTVSVLGRPPRCQCRRAGSDSKARVLTCVS